MDELLRVTDLTKQFRSGSFIFGEKITAVKDVNLSISASEPTILSLVGESGSGKTTLARMILRLIRPTQGAVHLDGKDVWSINSKRELLEFKRLVQPIFQNPYDSFNPVRPVLDALYETAVNLGIAGTRNEADNVVAETLNAVGLQLDEVKGKYLGSFSGGQLQRISVARALIPKPQLIVADEPVSALDASLRMNVINLFARLKDEYGVSFVYVTHDLSTAYYISDEVAIMYQGKIVEFGVADNVFGSPTHAYTQSLISAIPQVGIKWDEEVVHSP